MHRLERPRTPRAYTESRAAFVKDYPPAAGRPTESERWEAWKNECQEACAAVLDCLQKNQYGLCAFCEIPLSETNRQIEHFVPKSLTTTTQDWTINFENYTLACKGNENRHSLWYSDDPSHKANICCGHKKDQTDPRGKICNPYELPPYPVVREDIRPDGLFFVPDAAACRKAGIAPELVASTLDHLGLNCPNLARRRMNVWRKLMQDVEAVLAKSPEIQQEELTELAADQLEPLNGKLQSFYTTRLLCLSPEISYIQENIHE